MKKLALLFFLLATPAFATDDPFTETYAERKHSVLTELDKCDFINAKEIMLFSSIPVQILDADIKNTRNLFKETIRARSACFEDVMSKLDDLVGLTERYLKKNDDNLSLMHQNSLDNEMLYVINQRANITKRLLKSILADIEEAIKSIPADASALPSQGTAPASYYTESETTRHLVKMDMTLVMEMDRRQQVLDDLFLNFGEKPSLRHQAAAKINTAHHHLSRALLAFEDSYNQPQLVTLARLNSEISYATLQLGEILAVNPTLAELPKDLQRKMAILYRKARDLQRDISGSHADIMENIFTQDFSNWISELYEDLSQLGYAMQELKANLQNEIAPPPPQSPTEFVDHMLGEIQKMDELSALSISNTEEIKEIIEIKNLEEMDSLEELEPETQKEAAVIQTTPAPATEPISENKAATEEKTAKPEPLPEAEEITLPAGAQLGAEEFLFEEPETNLSPSIQPLLQPQENQPSPTDQKNPDLQ